MYRYLIFLLCLSFCLPIVAEEWQLLGKREVDRRLDVDVIRVSQGEVFNKIQIRILNQPVQLFDLKVHFRNGSVYNVSVQRNFSPGESSQIIDLPGRDRFIDNVKIKYRTTAFRKRKATLQLWGIKKGGRHNQSSKNHGKNNHGRNDHRQNNHSKAKWEYLGSKDVDRKQDRDVINISRREGSFQAVRLQVTESKIFLKDYRIIFANGEETRGTVGAFIAKNSYTNTLDLPGRSRIIQKVILSYSSTKRKRARVHLWGLQRTSNHKNNSHKRNNSHSDHKQRFSGHDRNNSHSNKHLVDQWQFLGKRQVDFKKDFDVIHVQGVKKFAKKIEVRVSGQTVEFKDLKVFFENGQFVDLSVRKSIPQGGSFVKDLPGNIRKIDRIQFLYKSKRKFFGNRQEAIVEVWAK